VGFRNIDMRVWVCAAWIVVGRRNWRRLHPDGQKMVLQRFWRVYVSMLKDPYREALSLGLSGKPERRN
jgi:hypothetical protein